MATEKKDPQTLTLQDIIREIRESSDVKYTAEEIYDILSHLHLVVKRAIQSRKKIRWRNFFTIETYTRKKRAFYNLRSKQYVKDGEEVTVVRCKPSSSLLK